MRWKVKHLPTEAELHVHKKFALLPTIVSDRDVLYYIWLEPYYMFQTAIYDGSDDYINTENYRYANKYECISMCKVQMDKGNYVL
jgi:hypothetical protein